MLQLLLFPGSLLHPGLLVLLRRMCSQPGTFAIQPEPLHTSTSVRAREQVSGSLKLHLGNTLTLMLRMSRLAPSLGAARVSVPFVRKGLSRGWYTRTIRTPRSGVREILPGRVDRLMTICLTNGKELEKQPPQARIIDWNLRK